MVDPVCSLFEDYQSSFMHKHEEAIHSKSKISHGGRRLARVVLWCVLGAWTLIPMLVVLKKYGAFEYPLYISPQ